MTLVIRPLCRTADISVFNTISLCLADLGVVHGSCPRMATLFG
jgi:hypothetical protein